MTEQKDTRAERRQTVYCKQSIWLENDQARPVKTPAGSIVKLTAEQIKHFGKAVTKDIPEGADDDNS